MLYYSAFSFLVTLYTYIQSKNRGFITANESFYALFCVIKK